MIHKASRKIQPTHLWTYSFIHSSTAIYQYLSMAQSADKTTDHQIYAYTIQFIADKTIAHNKVEYITIWYITITNDTEEE